MCVCVCGHLNKFCGDLNLVQSTQWTCPRKDAHLTRPLIDRKIEQATPDQKIVGSIAEGPMSH